MDKRDYDVRRDTAYGTLWLRLGFDLDEPPVRIEQRRGWTRASRPHFFVMLLGGNGKSVELTVQGRRLIVRGCLCFTDRHGGRPAPWAWRRWRHSTGHVDISVAKASGGEATSTQRERVDAFLVDLVTREFGENEEESRWRRVKASAIEGAMGLRCAEIAKLQAEIHQLEQEILDLEAEAERTRRERSVEVPAEPVPLFKGDH